MLSAAARPRWIAALMPDSPFSRSSSVSSATTYDMNSAKSNLRAAVALQQRDPDDRAHRARGEEHRERRARRGRRRLLGHRVAQAVRGGDGAVALVLLAAEHAHDAVPADHLLEHLRQRARAVLDVARDAPQAAAEIADHDADDRHDDERQQRQLPVEPQQVAEADGDGERGTDGVGEGARRGRSELVGVERDLRLDHAGRVRVVVRRGQLEAACR